MPFEGLTPPQRVEPFKIVTAGDYEEMRAFGACSVYRAGISPEGKWSPVFLTKDASGLVSGARSVFRAAATAVGA